MAEADLSRPYVGYRSAGRRPERQQDRAAAANAPLAALRGWAAGTLGLPGDIESLGRMLIPGASEDTFMPTSERMREVLPGRVLESSPAGRLFTEAGTLTGGAGVATGARLAGRGAGALGRLAAEGVERGVRSGSPLMAAVQPSYVVKPKGGNWLLGSVERTINPLRQFVREPEYLAQIRAMTDAPEGLYESTLAQNKRANAVNTWVDTKLAQYIKNEMGTPEDPVRKLAERGVLHYEPQGGAVRAHANREIAGMPADPTATGALARAWEDVSDAAIVGSPYKDFLRFGESVDEGLRRVGGEYALKNPEAMAYGMDTGTRPADLGFDHLLDELRNMLDPASGLPREFLLTPDQLGKITLPQAVERVARVNEWRAAQKAEANAALAMNPATHLVKEYPEQGFKWVELKAGDLPEGWSAGKDPLGVDVLTGPGGYSTNVGSVKDPRYQALEAALKYEGETMGHCVGGYCPDVMAGRSRIYSLRDAKGEPHVTVEVRPGVKINEGFEDWPDRDIIDSVYDNLPKRLRNKFSKWVEDNYDNYETILDALRDSDWNKYVPYSQEVPSAIVQIKGKGNKAPKEDYLPFVQDFVRSGQWSEVGDFKNTGLYRKSDFIDEFKPEQLDAIGQGEYLTMEEIRKLREGKNWKPIDTDPELDINIDNLGMKAGGEVKMAGGGLVKGYQSGGRVRPGAGLPDPTLVNLQLYADTVARQMFPRERENEQRDAARHMLAAALATQKTTPGVAEFLGKAHEFKEAPLRTAGHWLGLSAPRADYETDIHNNALGVELGRDKRTLQELLDAVETAVRSGTPKRQPGRVSLEPDADTRYAAGGLVSAGAIPYEPAKIDAIVNSLREELNA